MRGPRRSWIVAAIIITTMAGMLPVVQTSGTTVTGYEMEELEYHHRDLQSQIHQQESVIASLTALPRVEAEARRLGLEPSGSSLYIEVPVPAPTHQRLPLRFAPPSTKQPAEQESGIARLLKFIPFP